MTRDKPEQSGGTSGRRRRGAGKTAQSADKAPQQQPDPAETAPGTSADGEATSAVEWKWHAFIGRIVDGERYKHWFMSACQRCKHWFMSACSRCVAVWSVSPGTTNRARVAVLVAFVGLLVLVTVVSIVKLMQVETSPSAAQQIAAKNECTIFRPQYQQHLSPVLTEGGVKRYNRSVWCQYNHELAGWFAGQLAIGMPENSEWTRLHISDERTVSFASCTEDLPFHAGPSAASRLCTALFAVYEERTSRENVLENLNSAGLPTLTVADLRRFIPTLNTE